MRKSLITKILIFSFGLSTSVFAGDAGKQKGPETSVEQKSEQGLEHGEAYAGSKEKDDKDKGDKEKKEKDDKDKGDKEKKEKKEKGDKDKGDQKEKKGDKDKGDKKEKKGKKGKKGK